MRLLAMPGRPAQNLVFGVCGGLQWATGINAWMFRASFLLGAYFYTISTLLLFALLFVLMRQRRDRQGGLTEASATAGPTLVEDAPLHAEMRALELQLARLEADALSKDRLTARRFTEAGL